MNNGKSNINYTKLYDKSYGLERRENLTKEELYKGNPLPQTLSYKDIDLCFKEWVEKELLLIFDGKELPTMMLIANQRINEFGQSWKFNDSNGGLLLNFKTITRNNNPQKGTQQGGYMNIPGEPMWPVYYAPVIENGIETYDVYKMKQPMCIDLQYSVSIFSTNYELINQFNRIVQDKFKAITSYIRPNNYFLPMELENVKDESQYDLENRRFYSQTFEIKCMAYIINEDDFIRERLQTRTVISIDLENSKYKPIVTIEDTEEDEHQEIHLNINFFEGSKNITKFRLDEDVYVKGVKTENIFSFKLKRDNEEYDVNTCKNFHLKKYEKITIEIKRIDPFKEASIQFNGENFNYKPEPAK